MRCLTPVRVAIINKSTNKCWWRKGNSFALLVGLQTGGATAESSMEIPQEMDLRLTQLSHFWEYIQRKPKN